MSRTPFFCGICVLLICQELVAQDFEQAVVDIGNVGLTVTNVGFIGNANTRNNPTGDPSFEFPINSGVEHLFEAGLWIGAVRSDGVTQVRTAAATASSGYSPGGTGYETVPTTLIAEFSSLVGSDAFASRAISHQDFVSTFSDTAAVLPGTNIPAADPNGRLNAEVTLTTHAWNFPFAESFVILNFEITNIGQTAWDSVYVGLYHDLVVRNVNTTVDQGGAFFNKGGLGVIDSLFASYAFNAGGAEESQNTYGALVFLGAEWPDPVSGATRFIHPDVAQSLVDDGYPAPAYTPRWWFFSGGPSAELSRPADDRDRYNRMGTPYPNPLAFATEEEFLDARDAWHTTLRTGGVGANGNWIGLSSVGPISKLNPGDTYTVTFAAVAGSKPEEFQGLDVRALDTDESRRPLTENIVWAQRTYGGEDLNGNGVLDPTEDANGDGQLTRYLIPEPPSAPKVRVDLAEGKATVYWDRSSEDSKDPVSGRLDFEGYRVYRSSPGDDLAGDLLGQAGLIAQYDRPGNLIGFNNDFDDIRLASPVVFPDDETAYHYSFVDKGLLGGWQYAYIVTAFDEGDLDVGLQSFESSRTAGAVRVFPGTPPAGSSDQKVGVYPNPYRVNAAWDGTTSRTRKLNFYNLPSEAEVRIYTLAGEIVGEFLHNASTYAGDIRWFDDFSAGNRVFAGGEHAWDLLSESGLSLTTGLYMFSVKDAASGEVQVGKFAVIK